ncbi:MAG: glycosyltransferase N-terminal domain-containing protein [Pseudomonadota bacterium]
MRKTLNKAMKKLLKSLMRKQATIEVLAWLIVLAIRLMRLCIRRQALGEQAALSRLRKSGGIPVIWHQTIMLSTLFCPKDKAFFLVSSHRDGRLTQAVLRYMGYQALVLDSNLHNRDRLYQAIQLLQKGQVVTITPDGPRGPSHRVKRGLQLLARQSGQPVFCFGYGISKSYKLRSWDRHIIPIPLQDAVCLYGEPIEYREGLVDFDNRIMRYLNDLNSRATIMAARTDIKPADFATKPCWHYRVYYRLSIASGPAWRLLIKRRRSQDLEDPERWPERFGQTTMTRPPGRLGWIHAASLGETNSCLPLIKLLLERYPDLELLLTTGTRTSAIDVARKLPAKVRHQFICFDHPAWVSRFLGHWQPDFALITESELWPNLVYIARARGIRLAMINGRLSPKSIARWRLAPTLIREMLAQFTMLIAQSDQAAQWLGKLGANNIQCFGNLKYSAPALAAENQVTASLWAEIGDRPVWLAASTHPGEELMVLDAHAILRKQIPAILTIIVPRHPVRGGEIAKLVNARTQSSARRSLGSLPGGGIEIYLADTLGELGLFYRLSPIAFIGGTMRNWGGHNPMEAARLDCAIIHGPDMVNFASMETCLREAGATKMVKNADQLAEAVGDLLHHPGELRRRQIAGYNAASQASHTARDVLDALGPMIECQPLQHSDEGPEAGLPSQDHPNQHYA